MVLEFPVRVSNEGCCWVVPKDELPINGDRQKRFNPKGLSFTDIALEVFSPFRLNRITID
jgi:hypothetical protein